MDALTLHHYTHTPGPVEGLRKAFTPHPDPAQEYREDTVFGKLAHKPSGALWLSDDRFYGWLEWCRDNRSNFPWGVRYRRPVVLRADRTLVIPTAEALDRFTEWYGVDQVIPGSAVGFGMLIDWLAVMEDHAAVLISPYRWVRRLHTNSWWYYTWDCAAACVLDPEAIVHVGDPVPVPAGLLAAGGAP